MVAIFSTNWYRTYGETILANFTASVPAKLSSEDAEELRRLAASEGIKTGEFVRRELLQVIRRRHLGISPETKLILGHILAFQETVLAILKEVLADEHVSKQKVDDIKEHFDDLKDGLAEMAIRKESK